MQFWNTPIDKWLRQKLNSSMNLPQSSQEPDNSTHGIVID